MATDVRALLKAKTQERGKRITHPLAAYNAAGQLRCTVCAMNVKDTEVAWSGHLGSKTHRTNVGRQKEMIMKEEERKRLEKGKRKANVDEEDADESMEEDGPVDRAGTNKRQKTEEPERPSNAMPSNFFSDPTRTLPAQGSDDEDGQPKPVAAPSSTSKPSQIDLEWAQFERDVLANPAPARKAAQEDSLSRQEIYDRATVVASEEVLYNQDDGFPAHLQQARSGLVTTSTGVIGEVLVDVPQDETEEQKRTRLVRDEKELIMDRIMDEERAQEDADEKLRALKARLALVKKKREEERRKKAGGG